MEQTSEEFSKSVVYLQKCLKEALWERDLALNALGPFAIISWPKGKLKIEMKEVK